MVTYMYIDLGQGQTTPWDQIFFINSSIQSIYSFAAIFPQLNEQFSQFKRVQATQLDLAIKQSQGQPRVIIYINSVELDSPMLHAKFRDHMTSGYGEEDI